MEQIEEKTLQTVFSAALAMLSAYFGIVATTVPAWRQHGNRRIYPAKKEFTAYSKRLAIWP